MARSLRAWAILTASATFGLLVLGTLVTSFRVGMADPIWPTEPWKLALIDWSEPSQGFLIEHSHRLAGFTVGGMMAILAFGLWFTEPDRTIRWAGLVSLVGLLGSFGWLHGVLIKQTKDLAPGSSLSVPPVVAAALAISVLAVFVAACSVAVAQSNGWSLRFLGIALLMCVMVQGLLGGLRVYFNAVFAEGFSIFHAAFSQIVFGLVVLIASLLGERRGVSPTWNQPRADSTSGLRLDARHIAVLALYLQIVAGAMLRHLSRPTDARHHLFFAFVATVAVVVAGVVSWRARTARVVVVAVFSLLTAQVVLGIESWLVRFSDGFVTADLRRITEADAWVRTAHAVVGYALFGTCIRLAVATRRMTAGVESNALEAVA